MWSNTDIAWVAGLLEGEGYIGIPQKNLVLITINMTDQDVIQSIYDKLQIGTVHSSPKIYANQTKLVHHWSLSKQRDVARFLLAVAPLMGSRRKEKILEATESLYKRFGPRICKNCTKQFKSEFLGRTEYCKRVECQRDRNNQRVQKSYRARKNCE